MPQDRNFTDDVAVLVAHYLNNPIGLKPVEALILAQLHIYLQMNKQIAESDIIRVLTEPPMQNENTH